MTGKNILVSVLSFYFFLAIIFSMVYYTGVSVESPKVQAESKSEEDRERLKQWLLTLAPVTVLYYRDHP